MRRAGMLIVLLVSGCRTIFGLDEPQLIDARSDSSPIDQAQDARATDAAADATLNACGTDFVLGFGTSRYKLVPSGTDAVTWHAAAQICVSQGATGDRRTHLAVIGGDAEWEYIIAINGGTYWLGLTDLLTQGTFVWVTDETTSYPPATGNPWEASQPAGSGQDCVATLDTGFFQDALCNSTIGYLCECDAHPNDPTNYIP